MRPSPPDFCARVDPVLATAAARIRLLAAVTPEDTEAERARLAAALDAGKDAIPRWTYARVDYGDLAAELDRMADGLEALSNAEPLATVYAGRAAEMALEARLSGCPGTPAFGRLARRRFELLRPDEEHARTLARTWLALPDEPARGPSRTTDGPEPESLASRLRHAVGARRLPFAVEVRPGLASLAATGERTVFVAAGRTADDEDIRRTTLHEIEAHVVPRARAATLSPRIFQLGTARGADEQEGLALLLEERHGFLAPRRKRELALRHTTILSMDAGASFTECARALMRDHALPARDAVLLAERAYRGSDGNAPGLGRERIYLASYARVRAHLATHPNDEPVLLSGQVALEAIEALRPYS
jgi:hypothetical protein